MARPSLKLRLTIWLRAWRFRRAVKLVRKDDGVVVSATAWRVALDRLAAFSEWAASANLSRRAQASHEAIIEDITRLLVLAAEAGDPNLQLAGLQDRYVNIRMRAMPKAKRERLQYEAALRTLEQRIGGPPAPKRVLKRAAVCAHTRRVTPEGQYTKFKCLDCETVGDVKKETPVDLALGAEVNDTPGSVIMSATA